MFNGTKNIRNIRVAFLLNISENWIGGLNYYRSLISAIVENERSDIQPVVIIAKDINKNLLKDYPKVEIIETDLLTRYSILWFMRKIICKIMKRDFFLERFFRKHEIDAISHIQENLYSLNLPTIAWIPDFQHKYLPELFSNDEIRSRDNQFLMLSTLYDSVIVSSHDAKRDFIKFFAEFRDKVEVLQFVVPVNKVSLQNQKACVKDKYQIENKFFYMPNQYWLHKNHKVVLDALIILKQKNEKILVVSTGNSEDYRNKQHFSSLLNYINENDLSENFRVLGKIPYNDVQALSQNCIALINPSLFEGWSTTVEEAKSMGKRIILSSIAVHKEQNPEGGKFFEPSNVLQLAEIMWDLWNLEDDKSLKEKAEKNLALRRKFFSETYEKIVHNTVKRFKGDILE